MPHTLAIINPCSGSGATGRRIDEIDAKLNESLGPVEVRITSARRDAEEIARKSAESGVRRIVVAGGDGTASEVASGLLASGRADEVELGLLALGTGGDLARSLGLPRDLDAAIRGLARPTTRRIDAGRIDFQDLDGEPVVAHFLNVGSFGVSGLTDLLVECSPRIFGGSVAFAIAAIRSFFEYRPASTSLRVDGELVHRGAVSLVAVANGRSFGGGMKIAPSARLDSGIFDVVIVNDMSRFALLRKFPKIFSGRHVHDPVVSCHRGRTVEAAASPGTLLLDIDGEPLGTLPALFEILPRAITLFGVPEPGVDEPGRE